MSNRERIDVRIVESLLSNNIQEIPLVFTGNTTDLRVFLEEPIKIKNARAKIALRMISSTNSIPNIDGRNKNFRFKIGNGEWRNAELESGCYEVSDIEKSIEYLVNRQDDQNNNLILNPRHYNIQIGINEGLGKSIIKIPADFEIDFSVENSIGKVLGFNGIMLGEGIHQSPEIIKIQPVLSIFLFCNLVSGSYLNGKLSQSLYHFYPDVNLGTSFVETPNPIYYLDVPDFKEEIQEIRIWLTDQDEMPLNLNGENITAVLLLQITN